jgi:hypothetical protein
MHQFWVRLGERLAFFCWASNTSQPCAVLFTGREQCERKEETNERGQSRHRVQSRNRRSACKYIRAKGGRQRFLVALHKTKCARSVSERAHHREQQTFLSGRAAPAQHRETNHAQRANSRQPRGRLRDRCRLNRNTKVESAVDVE